MRFSILTHSFLDTPCNRNSIPKLLASPISSSVIWQSLYTCKIAIVNMGLYLGKRLSSVWWGKKTYKILMLGLDSAGKTTILYQLQLRQQVTTIPTIGFNVETIQFGNFNFTVWDLGAWTNNAIWNYYLHDTVGLIFVVDSNDKERIQEARDKLHRILNDDKTFSSLLVLANKQELPGAMSIPHVTAELDLNKVLHRKYFAQGCCAKTGEGLFEGLEWLASTISLKKS